ncbi:hypothetical protein [Burkholderia sp. S-53]|uniref:hypothetical protein n=1 Tax=Burkholderia sp. S-53 TaxID=2906514 RepID=UPI0021D01585|nr:hypothetical protein [Burkholderia sp. S-53]UXU86255.1 hypothetical protein LXM88_13765 [Burkholderia sp. S-53]
MRHALPDRPRARASNATRGMVSVASPAGIGLAGFVFMLLPAIVAVHGFPASTAASSGTVDLGGYSAAALVADALTFPVGLIAMAMARAR